MYALHRESHMAHNVPRRLLYFHHTLFATVSFGHLLEKFVAFSVQIFIKRLQNNVLIYKNLWLAWPLAKN